MSTATADKNKTIIDDIYTKHIIWLTMYLLTLLDTFVWEVLGNFFFDKVSHREPSINNVEIKWSFDRSLLIADSINGNELVTKSKRNQVQNLFYSVKLQNYDHGISKSQFPKASNTNDQNLLML